MHNNENIPEYTTENSEVEKEFENERNEIIREGDELNECTKEWRDWSLQLTGNGNLVITGKVDKWVFVNVLFHFYSSCLPVVGIIMHIPASAFHLQCFLDFPLVLNSVDLCFHFIFNLSLSILRLFMWSSFMYMIL